MNDETQFVLNSFSFLIWGALVMWMCAGFTMLEAGSVRTKNASVICLKNVGLYSIAGLTFYFVGYNIMYVGVPEGGCIGTISLFYGTTADEVTLLTGEDAAAKAAAAPLWSRTAMRRCPTGSSRWCRRHNRFDRLRHPGRAGQALVFLRLHHPVDRYRLSDRGRLDLGGGWLNAMGFKDFAGSTIVHSTGGWAALAGTLVVGARRGKFRPDGSIKPTPPSNVPAVSLGVLILWLGLVRL